MDLLHSRTNDRQTKILTRIPSFPSIRDWGRRRLSGSLGGWLAVQAADYKQQSPTPPKTSQEIQATSFLEILLSLPVSREMSDSANGVCGLCHTHAELVRSHIIPRFSFRQLKKADGHYFQISNDPNKPERKLQREIREHLFCAKCDNEVLQENEDHLARVLYGGTTLEFRAGRRVAHVRGLDYRKTKNCLLSILWRMSLSSDTFFEEVELGERHSERIRGILLNAEATDETEYGINICVPFFDQGFIGDWIVRPDFTRVGHNRVYRCLIAGFLYTFHVGSADLPTEMRSLILRKDGTCPIVKANVMEIPFLKHFCLEMVKAQAKRRER